MYVDSGRLVEKMYDKYSRYLSKRDCKDLTEDIINMVGRYGEFKTPLLEWLNGKRGFTDVVVNGFSLLELAYSLDDIFPNIPVAILILGLEKDSSFVYHGLAAIAGDNCLANPRIILGERCEYAIYKDNIWSFMLKNQTVEELRMYQLWQVLLLNPGLIVQVAYDHKDETALILQENGSYLVLMNEGGE